MIDLPEVFYEACRFVSDFGPCVTEANLLSLADQLIVVAGTEQDTLRALGITLHGRTNCLIAVLKIDERIGNVTIHNGGDDNIIVLGNKALPRECNLNFRFLGNRCCIFFPDIYQFPVNIAIAFLRSDEQILYWGAGATSVMSRIEVEGRGRKVVIGDDCMLSSGVWIRNHDMHTLFDAESLDILNATKPDIIIEQHVWIGFDALILSSPRIGFGSVVGARALLKRNLPEQSLAVGTPAHVTRTGIAWCRSEDRIQPVTLRRLERLRAIRSGQ